MSEQAIPLPVPPLTDERRAAELFALPPAEPRWLAEARRRDKQTSDVTSITATDRRALLTGYDAKQSELTALRSRLSEAEAAVEAGERAARPLLFPANTPPETQEWHFCQCGDDVVLLFWGYPDDEYGSTDFSVKPTWCEFIDTYDPTEHIVSAFWPRPKAVSPACQRDCKTCEPGAASALAFAAELACQVPGMPQAKCHGCGLPAHVARCRDEECPMKPAGGAGAGLQGEAGKEVGHA